MMREADYYIMLFWTLWPTRSGATLLHESILKARILVANVRKKC